MQFSESTPFRSQICLLWGGDLHSFQTQTDSSEAVIRASSSPLVMNPTRAEVMRETREREGVAGMKTASGQRRQTYCNHVVFLLIFTQISEIV